MDGRSGAVGEERERSAAVVGRGRRGERHRRALRDARGGYGQRRRGIRFIHDRKRGRGVRARADATGRGARGQRDQRRCGARRGCAVTELAEVVRAPCVHVARRAERDTVRVLRHHLADRDAGWQRDGYRGGRVVDGAVAQLADIVETPSLGTTGSRARRRRVVTRAHARHRTDRDRHGCGGRRRAGRAVAELSVGVVTPRVGAGLGQHHAVRVAGRDGSHELRRGHKRLHGIGDRGRDGAVADLARLVPAPRVDGARRRQRERVRVARRHRDRRDARGQVDLDRRRLVRRVADAELTQVVQAERVDRAAGRQYVARVVADRDGHRRDARGKADLRRRQIRPSGGRTARPELAELVVAPCVDGAGRGQREAVRVADRRLHHAHAGRRRGRHWQHGGGRRGRAKFSRRVEAPTDHLAQGRRHRLVR